MMWLLHTLCSTVKVDWQSNTLWWRTPPGRMLETTTTACAWVFQSLKCPTVSILGPFQIETGMKDNIKAKIHSIVCKTWSCSKTFQWLERHQLSEQKLPKLEYLINTYPWFPILYSQGMMSTSILITLEDRYALLDPPVSLTENKSSMFSSSLLRTEADTITSPSEVNFMLLPARK